MKSLLIAALPMMFLSLFPSTSLAAAKPNVLLVLTDDQGWADLRCHGAEQLDTPVLDQLAQDSVELTRFFVSPVCAPTRASLLTGRYSLRTGVYGVTRGFENMRSEETTIAECLKTAGYATGCFGKWHNGRHAPLHPNGQGFDEFIGFCGGHWNTYFDAPLEHNGEPYQTTGFITDALATEALRFIEANRDRPWLCYVPLNAPHSPWQAPDDLFEKYKQRGLNDETATAYAMIDNLDTNVGRLLRGLDQLKLAERTIVIFLTDNGANGDRFNAGMRGRKGSPHEGGVRSPLMVRWPGKFTAGRKVDRIAAHIDLLPTICELCGTKPTGNRPLDGRSLVPLLNGEPNDWPDRMLFVDKGTAPPDQHRSGSVRTQRWRAVQENGNWSLFDMRADPDQKTDLATAQPDELARLKSAYENWLGEVIPNGVPAPEIPVTSSQKSVELPASEAFLSSVGRGIRFSGNAGFANSWITDWTSLDATVHWPLAVADEGDWVVLIEFTCPDEDAGAELVVRCGDQHLPVQVTEAFDPAFQTGREHAEPSQNYAVRKWTQVEAGTIHLSPGRRELTIAAVRRPGRHLPDVKSVRLQRLLPGFNARAAN